MPTIMSICLCSACAASDPAPVTGHLRRSGWSCVYCGGSAVRISPLWCSVPMSVRSWVSSALFRLRWWWNFG